MLLTRKQVSEKYNVSKNAPDYWRQMGLPFIQDGKSILFDSDTVEQFLNEQKVKPTPVLKKYNGLICEICKEQTKYKTYDKLVKNHVEPLHNMTIQEYYDLLHPSAKYCGCGNVKTFISYNKGYVQFCSDDACPARNKHIQDNAAKTKLEKYGDTHFVNADKRKQTCIEKYGDTYYTNRKKCKTTMIERYGTNNVYAIPEVAQKIKQTCNERYGQDRYVNPDKISESHRKRFVPTLKKHLENSDCELVEYEDISSIKILCKKCNQIFEDDIKHLYSRYTNNIELCLHCNPKNSFVSSYEIELVEFIKSLYSGEVVTNSKNIIGKELDIYLPELSVAIEFNGIYWHSDIIKPYKYHLNKTELCEQHGIRLIHIFEDEWLKNKQLVKCKIQNVLGKTKYRVYARNCKVVYDVPISDQKSFYNENHQQGYVSNKITYGLILAGEYVAMMSFSSNRNKDKYDFELVRYATLKDYVIPGGATKLFSKFENNHTGSVVVSYADRCWSTGKLYETLGFELVKKTNPSYFYVSQNTLEREHRFKFRKENLKKLGYNDVDNRTEKEIMDEDSPYLRIFNSGYLVYKKII